MKRLLEGKIKQGGSRKPSHNKNQEIHGGEKKI